MHDKIQVEIDAVLVPFDLNTSIKTKDLKLVVMELIRPKSNSYVSLYLDL